MMFMVNAIPELPYRQELPWSSLHTFGPVSSTRLAGPRCCSWYLAWYSRSTGKEMIKRHKMSCNMNVDKASVRCESRKWSFDHEFCVSHYKS